MRTVLLSLAVTLLAAAPAAAAQRTVTVPSPGPGPAAYDKVTYTPIGPASARTVLVLIPGYYGGAGDFRLVGRDIVRRVRGLQVWAVDRRSQALEDTKMFDDARAGRVSVKQAFDYYLGWLADPSVTTHYQPPDVAKLGFAKRWGLQVALDGIRRIVLRARAQGKRVILGGHSLGGSLTTIYATWDFGGRPGYQDVDALILIDGGTLGTFATPTLKQTRDELAKLQAGSPFADVIGFGLPWAAGVFAQAGAVAALREPTAPSIGQAFAPLPAGYKPPVPATNRGLFGYAFDKETSASDPSLQANVGHLATTGDPRDWDDDAEVTPLERLADVFSGSPNATEWFFPERLRIEVDAAQELRRNAQTRLLGLRPWHLAEVDRPLYAYQTDLTNGGVLRGARRFVARSRSPRALARFVDGSKTDSHLDPLSAAPSTSRFLQTVVPWLRRVLDR
jgi:pimeloyl-ACP methyl ester carboxylesterase